MITTDDAVKVSVTGMFSEDRSFTRLDEFEIEMEKKQSNVSSLPSRFPHHQPASPPEP